MTACLWNGRNEPRVLSRRHEDECADEDCRGCQPCTESHCRICRRVHAEQTCPECIAGARDTLGRISTLCGLLPTEAATKGVTSEAMMLTGPTADPQAWRFRATSAMFGRVPDAYLNDCRDEKHPLWVLGTWEQTWRDHLDQPTDLKATLPRLADYLWERMHVMAAEPEVPFEDFARDLRGCLSHLEGVIHDKSQGDRAGVGCFECGGDLERRLTAEAGFEDWWTCQRCRRRYTHAEYMLAVRSGLESA